MDLIRRKPPPREQHPDAQRGWQPGVEGAEGGFVCEAGFGGGVLSEGRGDSGAWIIEQAITANTFDRTPARLADWDQRIAP